MSNYVKENPYTQVSGQLIKDMTAHLPLDAYLLLQAYGFDDVCVDDWYPQVDWINFLNEATSRTSLDLIALGSQYAHMMPLPMGSFTIPRLLDQLESAYQEAHRDTADIYFLAQICGERQVRIIDNSPYPDDLQYGIVFGIFSRMIPYDAQLLIQSVHSEEVFAAGYIVGW